MVQSGTEIYLSIIYIYTYIIIEHIYKHIKHF